MRPLLLLDSASLYYRSFHALPESMTAPDGRPHNAVRGFLSTLTRLVDAYRPAEVIACWDEDWRPAWRVELIPSYKAHRVADAESGDIDSTEAEPESLTPQAVAIAHLLSAAGIAPVGVPGFEADDVLATLAMAATVPVIGVSGDRDLVQIVDATTSLLLTVNGGMDKWPLLDPAGVRERFGVDPAQYVDLAVLRGDPSDGLPGVAGIGAKTAAALLGAYGDLTAVMAAARNDPAARPMTHRLSAALLADQDAVGRARTVATAVTSLEVDATRPLREEATLARLAAEWGVQRQVAELVAALDRQTADE
jgi:5'-3' exonuclease